MSETYVSAELRRLVATRADHLCEYCFVHEEDTFYGCGVDHIISEKHGGPTDLDNLAYSCLFCNLHKGSDIGSIFWQTRTLIRFYNPRTDRWTDHFRLDGITITPQSEIGEVTVRILELNHGDRMMERQALQDVGRYPSSQALMRIRLADTGGPGGEAPQG